MRSSSRTSSTRGRERLPPAADGLEGEIVCDGNRYPVNARVQGGAVAGHFLAGGASYGFDPQVVGDTLTFVTDDARYELRRVR